MRGFDLYRHVPRDMAETTVSGGIVSIVSLVIMIILFVTESITFLKVEMLSDMFVDSAAPAAASAASADPLTMRVNIDILLPVYPCAVLSVDVQDQLGSHMLDVGGALHKYRVRPLSSSQSAAAASVALASRSRDRGVRYSSALDALRAAHVELVPDAHGGRRPASIASASSSASASSASASSEAPTFAQAAAQRGEGCWVRGHLRVRLVPGNFHLSAHAHPDLLAALYGADRPHARMNISHVIHHLSFGEPPVSEDDDDEGMTRNFGRNGVGGRSGDKDSSVSALMALAPLDGTRQLATRHAKGTTSWEYYIKVVPTVVHRLGDADDAAPRRTFQFTANVNSVVGHFQLPAVFFRWDLSPITVRFRQRRQSFAHFLVQLCAIVGGVFTVLGLVNSFIHSSVLHVKRSIGKLT